MAIDYRENPLIVLAVNGYHPFSPDAGIFCGGYQGPLYPNPTILSLPNINFNPYDFQNPAATEYKMLSAGDVYVGLGSGNPGINYRNPGHILGLLDTYGRMSYGLEIIRATRWDEDGMGFGAAVDINIPLPLIDNSLNTIGLIDIYPAFSEKPNNYVSNFVDERFLLLDPRSDEPFIFENEKYSPNTDLIDFAPLFENALLTSYFVIPGVFQNLFDQMKFFAKNFTITLNRPIPHSSFVPDRSSWSDLPLPIIPESIDNFISDDGKTWSLDPNPPVETVFSNKCETTTVPLALKIMTGSPEYHTGPGIQNEYRSLTELNSVINLVPIQTNALKYIFFTDRVGETSGVPNNIWPFVNGFDLVSFAICDIVFNTHVSGPITIRGTASSTDSGQTFLPNKFICRNFSFATSVTNNFNWDRTWFGIENSNITTLDQFETFMLTPLIVEPTLDIHPISFNTFTPTTDFDFRETIQVGNGCHTIRARLIVQAKLITLGIGPNDKGYETIDIGVVVEGRDFSFVQNFVFE